MNAGDEIIEKTQTVVSVLFKIALIGGLTIVFGGPVYQSFIDGEYVLAGAGALILVAIGYGAFWWAVPGVE